MNVRTRQVSALTLACLILGAPSFAQDSDSQALSATSPDSEPADFNTEIYYRNKLEFAFDTGWLGYNIPLLFDPLMGDKFARVPGTVDYTLVPLNFSLRWQLYDICGRSLLRGNTDLTFTGSYTAITQGPESRYAAFITGVRYNFIPPNWRIVPYLEGRAGFGFTDARQPAELAARQPLIGQGEDLTFTFIMGTGFRYNLDPRYSISAGVAYMHISNFGLSEPKYYNHGVNVVGPNVGVNVAL